MHDMPDKRLPGPRLASSEPLPAPHSPLFVRLFSTLMAISADGARMNFHYSSHCDGLRPDARNGMCGVGWEWRVGDRARAELYLWWMEGPAAWDLGGILAVREAYVCWEVRRHR
jgi:hypothetical protein